MYFVIVAVNTRTYHFWPVVVESGVVTQQVSRYVNSQSDCQLSACIQFVYECIFSQTVCQSDGLCIHVYSASI